jgi:hypothetical protein
MTMQRPKKLCLETREKMLKFAYSLIQSAF